MSPTLTPLAFTFPLDLMLWVVFGVAMLIFTIFSAIMLWHWRTYSTGRFTTVANMLLYLGVGGGLLVVMALSVLSFSLV